MSTPPPPHAHGPDWVQRVTAIASLLTVMVAIAALLLTNNANRDQLRLADGQLQLAEQGQVTDRLARATDQLGSARIDVRLGGIYALEGVMNTSREYHQPVLEALCAFVRESTGGMIVSKQPASDVQAALTVIGRRSNGPGEVNLAGAKISGADFRGANLSHA